MQIESPTIGPSPFRSRKGLEMTCPHCGQSKTCGHCGRENIRTKGIIQDAAQWLADRWAKLEERYGRKVALTMAVAGLATFPIPGNVTAIIAAAEAIRAIQGWVSKNLSLDEIKSLSGEMKYIYRGWKIQPMLKGGWKVTKSPEDHRAGKQFQTEEEAKRWVDSQPEGMFGSKSAQRDQTVHNSRTGESGLVVRVVGDVAVVQVKPSGQGDDGIREWKVSDCVPVGEKDLDVEELLRRFLAQREEKGIKLRGPKLNPTTHYWEDEVVRPGTKIEYTGSRFGAKPGIYTVNFLGNNPSYGGFQIFTHEGPAFSVDDPDVRVKALTHSRFMLQGLVQEFRSFMEKLRSFGVRVPSLSDEQIAKTLEQAMDEAERQEGFRGRKTKSIGTQAIMDSVRQFNANPSLSALRRIKDEILQMTDDEASAVARKLSPGWRSDEAKEDAANEVYYTLLQKVSGRKHITLPPVVYTERWAIPMMKSSPFLGRMGVLTKDQGRWVTIGSHEGEGGSRVYIEDGKIRKGPSGVEGKPIADVDQNKEPGTPGGPKESEESKPVKEQKEDKPAEVRVFQSSRVREGFSYRQPPEIKNWMDGVFVSEYDPKELEAIDVYSQTEFRSINEDLRAGDDEPGPKDPGRVSSWTYSKSRVQFIDKAIQKNQLSEAVKVFRGFNCLECLKKMKVGEVFQDKAFFSTSLDSSVSGDFLTGRNAKEDRRGDVMLEISLPKGTNVGRGSQAHESELLLPRKSKFRIKKITKGSPTKVEVEYEK